MTSLGILCPPLRTRSATRFCASLTELNQRNTRRTSYPFNLHCFKNGTNDREAIVVSKAKSRLVAARLWILSSMSRPASNAARSTANGERAFAMASAFTYSSQSRISGNKPVAAVVLPAPFGPPMTKMRGMVMDSGDNRAAGRSRMKIQRPSAFSLDGSSVEPMGSDGVVSHKQVVSHATSAVGGVAYPILDAVLVRNWTEISRSMPENLIDAGDCTEFVQITPSQTPARIRAAAAAPRQKDPMVTPAGDLCPSFRNFTVQECLWVCGQFRLNPHGVF
jgi:hypothetical protein